MIHIYQSARSGDRARINIKTDSLFNRRTVYIPYAISDRVWHWMRLIRLEETQITTSKRNGELFALFFFLQTLNIKKWREDAVAGIVIEDDKWSIDSASTRKLKKLIFLFFCSLSPNAFFLRHCGSFFFRFVVCCYYCCCETRQRNRNRDTYPHSTTIQGLILYPYHHWNFIFCTRVILSFWAWFGSDSCCAAVWIASSFTFT